MRNLILFIIIFQITGFCTAEIIYVDVNAPNEPGTGTYDDPFNKIQNAINIAVDGDIIEISEGIYTSQGNYDLDPNGLAVTIRSTEPNSPDVTANTIIDPNKNGRAFYIHNNEDANCIIEGLTIRNGYDNFGGGIFCQNSSPLIRNCVIQDNEALSSGGGLFCWESDAKITGCTINSNTSASGGAVECWTGQPIIKNCIILNNKSLDPDEGGGAISCYDSGDVIIENCTITANLATTGIGGGILCVDSNIIIENSIFQANEANDGNQIALPFWFGFAARATVSYSDIEGGQANVYDPNNNLIWGAGNINVNPYFANFDPNGDPNLWDFHLQSSYGRWEPNGQVWINDSNDSPCIDAGDPNSDWSLELWPNGKRINMGAYGGTSRAGMNGNIADFDISGTVGLKDYASLSLLWMTEQNSIEDLNTNGMIGFEDIEIFGWNWLWQR